ncbi:glutamyl-tRNA amidotransferase [Thermosipho melanesiensis]|uniref:GatB/Yqey domain protein n=2 Tax=Thermosipho melanesiensis TaxID=46541 RepID=A6LM83_THEM4|nr:GatB/YqeY domain-containing protein [Thermosipho melanesiensis]ABR31034.1 GatB/Yqey domain protein [Thermosipho melanesiensis BI429]APT74128.1 glutamyl-tRNA amidotransferase [Thermosipho melanesiensis]OOC36076.1 glutamyl-tRNA amidotransferase [Thermosipho melanesiensis]OOC36893.1 glutamyl-tRNA amidotransferase [Thermosipho melanesiensis]OOC37644.1 glutamyl-tRNA amidotransferase [Thermosipho melanesiensis]
MLKEKLLNDLKIAMKEKNQIKLRVIRLLNSAIKNFEVEKKGEATDEEIGKIILKEIKKRQESIDAYRHAGREELAKEEELELNILKEYAPKMLSEDEIKVIVEEIINNLQEKNFGKIMKEAMAKLKGKADGALVSKVVKNLLK